MAKKLYDLSIEHVALVDRPANKRKLLIIKAAKPDPDPEPKPEPKLEKGAIMLTKEQIAKISDAKIQEAVVAQSEEIVALQKKEKELETQIEKLKAGGSTDDEEIWKNVPPAIRNRFEAMEKEKKEAEKRAEDEKDNREVAHWVEKSKAWTYLQLVPHTFGKVMKNISKACPDDAKEIERILGVAQDVIAKGAVFSELGRTNPNGSRYADATNVTARVDALADDYMKIDPKLTKTEAIAKVFREHSDWYGPYTRESQVRV